VSRIELLGAVLRVPEADWDADWSNFFLRSLTLGGMPPAVPRPLSGVADGLVPPDRLSTGFEAERWLGRRAERWVTGTAGCLGVVPLPLDRNDGGCRGLLLDTAGAMESFTGGEAFPAPPVGWTVR
jgi:hypothetical protein